MRGAAAGIAAVALGIAALLFVVDSADDPYPWVNHDVSLMSYLGLDIARGAKLYVDAYEMNPPAGHFLAAGIVLLADATSIPLILLGHLVVLALGAAGLWVLHRTFAGEDEGPMLLLVTLAYLLVIVRGNFGNNVLRSEPGLPYDFGQREQLFAILFAPYVLWSLSARRVGRAMLPYLVALGYVAMLKPYWPVLIAAVEVATVLRHGRRSGSAYGALGLGLALPWIVLVAHSRESFRAFFVELVPWVLGGSYTPYDMALRDFAVTPLHVQMVSSGILFVVCWLSCYRIRRPDRASLWLLLGIAAATYGSVIHQHKFWSYHAMVYFAVVVTAGIYLVAAYIASRPAAGRRDARGFVVAAILLAVLASSLAGLKRMLRDVAPKGVELVEVIRDTGSVMVFSTAADYAYAPLILRKPIVGPWREHFMLGSLLLIADPKRREEQLDAYGRRVRARIEETRPELLLFAPYRFALPPGMSIHDVLTAHGAIPPGEYERQPADQLVAIDPRLFGWIAYRRLPAAQEAATPREDGSS